MTIPFRSMVRSPISRLPLSIPREFLAETVADIGSMAELQVCLAFFRLIGELEGDETPIAERTIVRDSTLRNALRRDGIVSDPESRILQGLELAVGRGTIIRFKTKSGSRQSYWYYLNTPVNRATIGAMERGSLSPPAIIWEGQAVPAVSIDPPNAFQLYEQNIGPLTPLIADQISRAVEEYPGDWIEDAIAESVNYNRRSWRYVLRILENWNAMGRRDDEER